MFTVRYHPEAEAEATELPITIRVKYDKLVKKLEADPTQLREPHTKPLGGGVFELRTMGLISPADCGYTRKQRRFIF